MVWKLPYVLETEKWIQKMVQMKDFTNWWPGYWCTDKLDFVIIELNKIKEQLTVQIRWDSNVYFSKKMCYVFSIMSFKNNYHM